MIKTLSQVPFACNRNFNSSCNFLGLFSQRIRFQVSAKVTGILKQRNKSITSTV